MRRTLSVKLNEHEYSQLEFLRQGRSVTETIRDLISQAGRTEEKETRGVVQNLQLIEKIFQEVDYMYVRFDRIIDIVSALLESVQKLITMIEQAAETEGIDSDLKAIANALYSLGQVDNQRGWRAIGQTERQWIVDIIKKGKEVK